MKSRVYACRLLPPSSIGHYEENNANINMQGWDVDSRRNMQQTQQHSTHAIILHKQGLPWFEISWNTSRDSMHNNQHSRSEEVIS